MRQVADCTDGTAERFVIYFMIVHMSTDAHVQFSIDDFDWRLHFECMEQQILNLTCQGKFITSD